MPDRDDRREQILRAAATVIIGRGYDKTTMGDIADAAGVSRGTVYLYFTGKEELFEALLYREWAEYAKTWWAALEADPRGGTVGGYYRAVFKAVDSHPLMASMMRRDRHVVGNYLRKSDSMFAKLDAGTLTVDFIRALQDAGAVRRDVDPAVTAHLFESLTYGQLAIGEFKPSADFPPFPAVLEALADLMDRWLLPEDGGDSEAGKRAIAALVADAMGRIEQGERS